MAATDHAPYSLREEIAHAASHGLGLVLSAAGLVVLVVAAAGRGEARHVVACAIFGATLVLLYAASTLYHGIPAPRVKRLLRVADHAAIYLLIAGTYTPFALVYLNGVFGLALLAVIWSLAALGITLELAAPRAARRLSLGLYLAMGWLAVVAIVPLARALGGEGVSA